jgi:hypothetical protein
VFLKEATKVEGLDDALLEMVWMPSFGLVLFWFWVRSASILKIILGVLIMALSQYSYFPFDIDILTQM